MCLNAEKYCAYTAERKKGQLNPKKNGINTNNLGTQMSSKCSCYKKY